MHGLIGHIQKEIAHTKMTVTNNPKRRGMTRREFTELTGEDPEDMFGPDWQAILADFNEYVEDDGTRRPRKEPHDPDVEKMAKEPT